MALYGDSATAMAAVEPQDDCEDDPHEDELGMDLLARARLLCQAANEIALPLLQTVQTLQPLQEPQKVTASRLTTREEDDRESQSLLEKKSRASKQGSRVKSEESRLSKQAESFPPIARIQPPTLPHQKQKPHSKSTVRKTKRETEDEETVMPLPQIHVTEEWRKQRETEKIRQAQERAKARVLRKSNQVETDVLKSNQYAEEDRRRRPQSSETTNENPQSQVEANRRRALERVKLRKLEMAEEHAKAAAAKQEALADLQRTEEMAKKAEAFRHRTLQRLQAAKREAQAQETQQEAAEANATKSADSHEDAGEQERQRKRQEKQRRRETAERMKKQQQIAEEQQRREQELFEKGLNDFRTKKKEQDRVAKGLRAPKLEGTDPVVVFNPSINQTDGPAATEHNQPIADHDDVDPVPTELQEDKRELVCEELTLSVPKDHRDSDDTRPTSIETTTARPRTKKKPSWKQPPVPILPAENYTHKAIVSPSDSYAERFQLRSGRLSPDAVPEATFSPPHVRRL